MPTAREKGLQECRKVKKILEGMGFKVEGPGYKPLFIPPNKQKNQPSKMTVVHKDYFGLYDLMIMGPHHIFGVQVTADAGNRSEKAKNLENGPLGFVWYPIKEGRKNVYRILAVRSGGDAVWTENEFKEKMGSEV